MEKKDAKYAPSNGVEGETFMKAFCYACAKHKDGACDILNRALMFGIADDGYPDEWVFTLSNSAKEMLDSARCTAFELAEVNPFEGTEIVKKMDSAEGYPSQAEGQNLIDDDAEQPVKADHKCNSCALVYEICGSSTAIYFSDVNKIDQSEILPEEDYIISCDSFTAKHNLSDVVAFSPSPLDRYSAKFTKELPVPVPEEELAGYAQEMARIHARWVKTKLDAKAFAKSCKNVTDECEERELEIAEIINAGAELRPVMVFWSYDFTHHVKRLVRTDTREVVEEAVLAPEDYQSDLPLFDTVEEAEPVEVFETGTIEGGSGGEGEIGAQIEDSGVMVMESTPTDENQDERREAFVEGDISEGISTEDLDAGWPDIPVHTK